MVVPPTQPVRLEGRLCGVHLSPPSGHYLSLWALTGGIPWGPSGLLSSSGGLGGPQPLNWVAHS